MTETRWYTYARNLIGADTAQEAASRAGFNSSSFSRWKGGANAEPEAAVKLARAYGANVLQALAESGLITDTEAALHTVTVGNREAIEGAGSRQLLEELLRRDKK
ncbi:hypothetical protein QN354_09410 [Cryobacterium sp. 5I3]|uniref:hypothetical protein n=1 Tax=Cryobacterium sp. 5I3 TaxID=3048592 RepID=UPI002B222F4A|nr:hypothetical protein [Cryobacterium sp. 5I3]MEB0201972.1 hypothetical protein [Cryobacterium sp. 5I3]